MGMEKRVGVRMRDNVIWIAGSSRSVWEPDGLDYKGRVQCIGRPEFYGEE